MIICVILYPNKEQCGVQIAIIILTKEHCTGIMHQYFLSICCIFKLYAKKLLVTLTENNKIIVIFQTVFTWDKREEHDLALSFK